MLRRIVISGFLFALAANPVAADWRDLYQPIDSSEIPCRLMKPINLDAGTKYPVIVSLHGAGGTGTDNRKQLKPWNQQLAESARRTRFPCYVVAPQAPGLWNARHLKAIQMIIKGLPSVDRDRIYILGHSMGGHGTYIFIQLEPDYFAAAAPSAGSGRRMTADFIDPAKIRHIPIWAFHGDQDGICPIAKDRKVFDQLKQLGGTMKFTTWVGDKHAVSGKFIPGSDNGTTLLSSKRCDKEPDFMTWLFRQKRHD